MLRNLVYVGVSVLLVVGAAISAWILRLARIDASVSELQRVAAQQEIDVRVVREAFQTSVNGVWITGSGIANWQLGSHPTLLGAELAIYPPEVFRAIGLRSIIICQSLTTDGQTLGGIGLALEGTLYVNARAGARSAKYQRRIIHHELFHMIDALDDGTYVDASWIELNDESFSYGRGGLVFGRQHRGGANYSDIQGFLSHYSTSAVGEDKAEIFASMVVDYDYVEDRANADPVIRAKVERIKEILVLFSDQLGPDFWRRRVRRQ